MKALLFLLVLAALAIAWALNRAQGANLRAELASLRQENGQLAAARREHERLQGLLQLARTDRDRQTAASVVPMAPAKPAAPSRGLELGEWRGPASWQNRGQATPAAALETALWAAAGGELGALQAMLHLDDAVRAKAEALRARLPAMSRAAYPNAETLLAAFATKSLPLGDAQLVWNHQANDHEAWACLFVKNPEHVPGAPRAQAPMAATRDEAIARAAALREARAKGDAPPSAPANEATRALYVVLQRSDTAGWRLVVSPTTVDRIAKELAGPE